MLDNEIRSMMQRSGIKGELMNVAAVKGAAPAPVVDARTDSRDLRAQFTIEGAVEMRMAGANLGH